MARLNAIFLFKIPNLKNEGPVLSFLLDLLINTAGNMVLCTANPHFIRSSLSELSAILGAQLIRAV